MNWAVTRERRGTSVAALRRRRRSARAGVLLGLTLASGVLSPLAPTAQASPQRWYGYPVGVQSVQVCDERACVHRATSGVHAATESWARTALARVARSWDVLVEEQRFRAPAASAAADGDTRFHVYLADTGADDQYGQTVYGNAVPGHPRRARSYLVVDNDMAGLGGDPGQNLAATVAHEFFHAIQLNHDAGEDQWFMEASATWAETQVFPHLPANRRYLHEGQLGERGTPLDSLASAYGNFLLLERLTQVAGPDAVRRVWERLDASAGARNEFSLEAIAAVLAGAGVSWNRFYTDFAVANALPSQHYAERLRGTSAPADLRVTLGPSRRSTVQSARLAHLTARTTVLKVSKKARKRRVAVTVTTTDATRTGAALLVVRRDGSVRRVPLTFATKGPHKGRARASVLVKRGKVARLVLVTANTSRAFADCGHSSGWACGGVPVHDRTRVQVRARLR